MIAQYPALSPEEFDRACATILQRWNACEELGTSSTWANVRQLGKALIIRKEWNLQIRIGSQETQVRESDPGRDDDDVSIDADDIDTGNQVSRTKSEGPRIVVDYSIVLSPTYCVPVLWFTFMQLPPSGPRGFDAVYEYLIPPTSKRAVQQVGNIGAVSCGSHPVTDLPAFYVHPCNTQHAMKALANTTLSPGEYLTMWLGVIGPAVDLHIPVEMMRAKD